jgi:acyl-CoA oxidase
MLGTLVQGRVSLDGAAVAASKVALKTAIQYATERRQFNASSPVEEEVLLDYQRHQRRLFTRLATTYAAGFAHEQLLQKLDDVFSGAHDTDEDRQDLETLAAALKPLSTWHALDTLQECREACGGAGFLIENRFASFRADLDVYATFEGDNTVLLQLVAKRLLADYAKEFRSVDFGVLARYVVGQAAGAAVHRTGLRQVAQFVADSGSVQKAAIALRDEEGQRALLTDRVQTMVAEAAAALKGARRLSAARRARPCSTGTRTNSSMPPRRMPNCCSGRPSRRRWAMFTDPGTRTVLTWLRDLFGLSLIEKNLSWYLMNGRLSMQRGRTVGEYINRLLVKIRPHALDLVDAFGYGPKTTCAQPSPPAPRRNARTRRAPTSAAAGQRQAPVDEKLLLARTAGNRV